MCVRRILASFKKKEDIAAVAKAANSLYCTSSSRTTKQQRDPDPEFHLFQTESEPTQPQTRSIRSSRNRGWHMNNKMHRKVVESRRHTYRSTLSMHINPLTSETANQRKPM